MNKRPLWAVAFLLPLVGCHPYTASVCDDLAMKKYQGRPFEAADYDRHCKDKIKHPITTAVCERAMVALILHGQEGKLKHDFGPAIMKCFTKADLANFLNAPGGQRSSNK